MSEMTKSLFLLSFLRTMKCMFPSCRPLQDGEACLGGFSRKKNGFRPTTLVSVIRFHLLLLNFKRKQSNETCWKGKRAFFLSFEMELSFLFLLLNGDHVSHVSHVVFSLFFLFFCWGKVTSRRGGERRKSSVLLK